MPTESDLRRLYLEEHHTETVIARQFGISQVHVGYLRRKFGIETLRTTDRLNLPAAFTPRQHSIFIGSMLGDGGLAQRGKGTACYSEHHCVKQNDYLDWKVAELSPFVSGVGHERKGQHLGRKMRTHALPMFYPFWRLFYPSGVGDKTYIGLEVEQVDELALAVWYLDDGSRTESYVRFSVGAVAVDNEVRLRVLAKFGIDARVYEHGKSIHITNRTSLTKFLDAVLPHVPDCMRYKFAFKRPRALGPAPRHRVVHEELTQLVARGMSLTTIARYFGVSSGVVSRAVDLLNLPRPKVGRRRPDGGVERARLILSGAENQP